MIIATEKQKNDISIIVGIYSDFVHSKEQRVIINIVNKDQRNLLSIEAKTKSGIVLALECFMMATDHIRLSDRLFQIRKNFCNILQVTGKIGEDNEQLADKPGQENEYYILAKHFDLATPDEVWELIRSTGFHELLPA